MAKTRTPPHAGIGPSMTRPSSLVKSFTTISRLLNKNDVKGTVAELLSNTGREFLVLLKVLWCRIVRRCKGPLARTIEYCKSSRTIPVPRSLSETYFRRRYLPGLTNIHSEERAEFAIRGASENKDIPELDPLLQSCL